ncbi:MAG: ComF family protein [Ruminococcus sp.]
MNFWRRNYPSYAGIPVDTAILKKCHATRSQKKLDAAERKKNLQKAFQVVGNPAGMRILLIDDVYTTGSTMDVLAKLLLEKGASHVYFLTLCIGNNR